MAHVCRHYDATPEDVFSVLADPTTYPDWLIGAAKIRDVDENFPSPGSKFHHMVGMRPFVVADYSEVLDVEPDRVLVLHVKARPLFAGKVAFRITGSDEGCVLTCEEIPDLPLVPLRPLIDPLVHARNQKSLQSMETLVMQRKQERLRREAAAASS